MIRRLVFTSSRRCRSYRFRQYHELSFARTGEPVDVLEYHHSNDDECLMPNNDSLVRVKMWQAPLNPADINTIQGRYPSVYKDVNEARDALRQSRFKTLSTIAGSEGWGIVSHVPEGATKSQHYSLKEGDVVTFGQTGLGTFRSSLWVPPSALIRVDRGEELYEEMGSASCTLFQLGGTAIRMLQDFVDLQPGHVVIQNAGNSGVGLMASQLGAVLQDLCIVSLVRRGKRTKQEFQNLVDFLTTTGKATMVVAEEDVMSSREALRDFQSQLLQLNGKSPLLALNAVGGDSASLLLKCLVPGGKMVTYGGMSMKPVTVSTSQFIFKDLTLSGYWHSQWMAEADYKSKKVMIDELTSGVLEKNIQCPPPQEFKLQDWQVALEFDANQTGGIRRKVVFDCREEN